MNRLDAFRALPERLSLDEKRELYSLFVANPEQGVLKVMELAANHGFLHPNRSPYLNPAPPPTGTTVDRHCVHARLHEPHRGGGPRGRLGFFRANPSTTGIAMLQLPRP